MMRPEDVLAELVEKAAQATYYADPFYRSVFGKILEPREALPWDELDLADIQEMRNNARHALAAVLPEIQAQAWDEAARVVHAEARHQTELARRRSLGAEYTAQRLLVIEKVLRDRAARLTATTDERGEADPGLLLILLGGIVAVLLGAGVVALLAGGAA